MPTEPETFRAFVLDRADDDVVGAVQQLPTDHLPDGDVLVRVAWSGLNYKDALAVTNRGRIVRAFPMVPGIDLAGTVVESAAPLFAVGDEVLVTGYGIGEEHWGGYAQLARVRSEWLVPMPKGLDARRTMAIGTAGFTAMLSVMTLQEHGLAPGDDVVVTGASGGVGSFAVALLARAGYQVAASTGRPALSDYLTGLGAHEIVPRAELAEPSDKPLGSERWAGAVDSVGGVTLANLVRTTRRHGSVASCGLAGGVQLSTTVFPFILRGVNVLGIDSNYCTQARRRRAWARLAEELASETIETIIQDTATLDGLAVASQALLEGRACGRVLVSVGDAD